ncbi:MAG: DNA-directed RNA polymerase subunit omega [Bdellovibrionales bacterium]
MARITVEDCLDKEVDNRFALVLLVCKARETDT